jgi:hypothetical protein
LPEFEHLQLSGSIAGELGLWDDADSADRNRGARIETVMMVKALVLRSIGGRF